MSLSITRIIYMEDDLGLAKLLKKSLERHRYSVDIATNGEEGIAMLADSYYSVAVVDYNMPVLGGMEVMRRLSEMEQAPAVIMLTGDGNENIAVDAMKLGAADYLVKDVEMHYLELLPIIIEQVRQRQRLLNEREAILREARESEERYRKLVELSPDGICVHSGGRFDFINPAGAEMLGASSCEELVGRKVLDFLHPDYHRVFEERNRILELSDTELPWLEQKMLRCDGSELDVEATAVRFSSKGGMAFHSMFRDITERKGAERRLEWMANYDPLTSLPNRTLFFDRLNQLMLQANREEFCFAMLFIDLDSFKETNDRLGHYFGDLLLKEVAHRLVSCVRGSDTVARMGGDEFVVILSSIENREDAATMAQRIGESISTPYSIQGAECRIGASIGISIYPDDGGSEELQVKADKAMYRSKKSGRNKYQFYS